MTLRLDTQHAYTGGSNASLVSKMMAQSGAPPIWRLFHPTSTSDPCSSRNALIQSYAAHDTSFHTTFACQNQGNDVVGGRSAQRWLVTSTDRNGRKATGMAWIDSRLRIVSKTQDSTGTMQLANIQEGPNPLRSSRYRHRTTSSTCTGCSAALSSPATTSVTKKLKGILRLP